MGGCTLLSISKMSPKFSTKNADSKSANVHFSVIVDLCYASRLCSASLNAQTQRRRSFGLAWVRCKVVIPSFSKFSGRPLHPSAIIGRVKGDPFEESKKLKICSVNAIVLVAL